MQAFFQLYYLLSVKTIIGSVLFLHLLTVWIQVYNPNSLKLSMQFQHFTAISEKT